jgi:DnaJ-class molecular chaperone
VSLWRWALGGEITVPTLDGTARIAMPSRPAAFFVKNQGWPHFKERDRRKPLLLVPKMVGPSSWSEQERRLLQAMDARARLAEVEAWRSQVDSWRQLAAQVRA